MMAIQMLKLQLPDNIMLWGVLLTSMVILIILMFRNKMVLRWTGYALLNMSLAAVSLYVINSFSVFGDLTIPLSAINIALIAVLGIPGVALVAALYQWVIV